MRGRPDAACKDAVHPRDSSPPTRGRQSMGGFLWGLPRFIPSYEGQTSLLRQSVIKRVIHPLLQGADFPKRFSASFPADSSPPVRGRLKSRRKKHSIDRFIPSHEGQTTIFRDKWTFQTIHPLLRGADSMFSMTLSVSRDSSPPTRGRRSMSITVL